MNRPTLPIMLFVWAAGATQAQNYNIPWSAITGGGGSSSGGAYALAGTIGQPGVGPMEVPVAFRVEGGFQAVALKLAGYPRLGIAIENGQVTLSWETKESAFILQQKDELAPGAWTDLAATPVVNGELRTVTFPKPEGVAKRFYRLRRP